MTPSPSPFLEDWQSHRGAVSVSASGEEFLISGMGSRFFLRCSAEELIPLLRKVSENAAAFAEYCRSHPAHQQPKSAASTAVSLSDLGL